MSRWLVQEGDGLPTSIEITADKLEINTDGSLIFLDRKVKDKRGGWNWIVIRVIPARRLMQCQIISRSDENV